MALYTSTLTAGGNRFQTTPEHLNAFAKDLLTGSGVIGTFVNNIGAGSTGGFGLDAQGTPDNTISIRAGVAYILATPTAQAAQLLRVEATAAQTLTIATNGTASIRYDWVYIKIDTTLAANPAIDSTDVATIFVSNSTSNVSDTGASPATGLLLGIITVNIGFTTLANAVIAGRRVAAVLKAGISTIVPAAIASASTITPTAQIYDVTALAVPATIAVPSFELANGMVFVIRIKDNGTARALTFASGYTDVTGIGLPTTTVASKLLTIGAMYNSATSKWEIQGINQQA